MTDSHKPKVYVLGTDRAQGQGLAECLSADTRFDVVELASFKHLVETAGAKPRGCAVVDVSAICHDGFDVAGEIRSRHPALSVVLVSRSPVVYSTLDAVRRGSIPVIDLAAGAEGLAEAVALACAAAPVSTSDVLVEMGRRQFLDRLSPRELEVLKLLISGQQNKGIAHTLGISPRTVEVHRSRMMRRLGVSSFAELIRLAVEAGIKSE